MTEYVCNYLKTLYIYNALSAFINGVHSLAQFAES